MCRFVLYLGPELTLSSLITEPSHSIVNQSFKSQEREEPVNGDGFGFAWWKHDLGARPGLFRSITPAWNNANLLHLARLTRSCAIMAHVRAATQITAVSEVNCHPFSAGPYAFMHNGDIGGFTRIRRAMLSRLTDESFGLIHGLTDSEHFFALAMDALRHCGLADGGATADDLGDALERALGVALALGRDAGLDDHTYLNCAFSNGRTAAAVRFTTNDPKYAESLYLHRGRRYVCEGGVCRMLDPEEGHGAVIVASEPLSDDPGWESIPPNHVALISDSGSVNLRPFGVGQLAGV
ncbi:MAG: class II glutamine amidotransferase [Phycisphaerales bacterium JB039]